MDNSTIAYLILVSCFIYAVRNTIGKANKFLSENDNAREAAKGFAFKLLSKWLR